MHVFQAFVKLNLSNTRQRRHINLQELLGCSPELGSVLLFDALLSAIPLLVKCTTAAKDIGLMISGNV